jgi:YHS domain-containing protein
MNRLTLKAIATAATLTFASFSFAGVDTETDENGIIPAGHDAVAYFTQGKPVIGNAKYTAVYNDAIYRFSSAENRDLFAQNPGKYAPMYGGFCAYGTTFGKKFEIDGKAFKIVGGKLFVNKNLDVLNAWHEDIPKHLVEANEEWPAIKDIAAENL